MIKEYTKSRCANLFIAAAESLSLKYEVIDEKTVLVRVYNVEKDLYFKRNVTSFNHTIGSTISIHKDLALRVLKRKQVPIPESVTFQDRQEARVYANECSFPIVIKPPNGSCAIGVTIKPTGEAQIDAALDEVFAKSKSVMVEEFIEGLDYRVTMFDGEIVAVTYRASGYVIGDGKRTLQELIEKKNEIRKKDNISLIKIRKKDLDFLSNRNIDLKYVPSMDEYVRLQLGCDRDIGGERHRIELGDIPDENKELFAKIAGTVLLRFTGIDFIIPDITKSYRLQKCGVNEVNSAPMQDVHYFDTLPGDNYSCRRILKLYFDID